MERNTKMRCL
ncbi:Protein of unknown function [Bacillus cytotoxicus]|uniref:Uncharacterized protein n=1 Tax=Bacillus cytotoxicus TaxID=580165 RepID=A0AAX2CJI0_9BACI|nr:Protein of unknown function [Bacillus cytotoxicus]SCN39855.1 Protein of unknown function [Bacillus cytotoxicus]